MIQIGPGRVVGKLRAPASKSLTQRAILLAALAKGESRILSPSLCDDAEAALRAAQTLGAKVTRDGDGIRIRGGVPAGGTIDCGESGFCMRAVPALAALSGEAFTLEAGGSLAGRPMEMLESPLRTLGAECATSGGRPPVHVRGPLRGGDAVVDGSETSQLLSGLLMALPLCPSDSNIRVPSLRSRPYVAMTLSLIREFGGVVEAPPELSSFAVSGGQRYRASEVEVEGDWSGASFLLIAGALAGDILVEGLWPASLQADRAILAALSLSGAEVVWEKMGLRVERDDLHGFDFDATHCPDLFPPLAALACGCAGESRIAGVGRLRHKESDRAAALAEELGKVGGHLQVEGDILCVEGTALRGGEADSRGDHRIAMALAVAGLISREGVRIRGASCVSKSYPGFFGDLRGMMRRE